MKGFHAFLDSFYFYGPARLFSKLCQEVELLDLARRPCEAEGGYSFQACVRESTARWVDGLTNGQEGRLPHPVGQAQPRGPAALHRHGPV